MYQINLNPIIGPIRVAYLNQTVSKFPFILVLPFRVGKVCNWCYAIYTWAAVTLFRELILSPYSEKLSLVCDLVTGGVDLPDASSRLLRGVSEGRKVGSLLTAVSGSPAEGEESCWRRGRRASRRC